MPAGVPKPDYSETSIPTSEQDARGSHSIDCKVLPPST